jgi:TPR repeat protein
MSASGIALTVTQDPVTQVSEAPAAASSAPAVPGVASRALNGFVSFLPVAIQYTYAGLTSDKEQSMSLYVAAAAQGHPGAQFALAKNFEKAENLQEAFKYYKQAADLGSMEAQVKVGEFYENGKGVQRDYIFACTYYQKAADCGSVESMFKLGELYEFLLGDVDLVKAFQNYKKAADHKHVGAQYKVAQFYEHGIGGVEKNPVEAFKYYEKAAYQQHVEALFKTAECYELGIGTGASPKYAFNSYQAAAGLRHPRAQHKVGDFYLNGIYVYADPAKALDAYEEAVKLGNPASQKLLQQLQSCLDQTQGNILEGVNPNLAFVYFLKKANQGDAVAQFAVAGCYAMGRGTPIDERKAAQFCGKAAEQRHAHATLCLADMYEQGKGVKKSREKASLCYQKALFLGLANPQAEAEAKTRLEALVQEIELEIQKEIS